MAIYAVGDIQGCLDPLERLLSQLGFDPRQDQMWFVGDLVNRGPEPLGTLRLVKGLGQGARLVLGNHDLHLLALAITGAARTDQRDLRQVLDAPDCEELVHWLLQQPLAIHEPGLNVLMVHAGVHPDWSVEDVLQLAGEVETVLRGDGAGNFLGAMYGDKPLRWKKQLTGEIRLRFITNCLTRIRFCHPDGSLDFGAKGPPEDHADLVPWFDMPGRRTTETRIVCGHWSALGYVQRPDMVALDTGCVWGRELTAVRLDAPADPVSVPAVN